MLRRSVLSAFAKFFEHDDDDDEDSDDEQLLRQTLASMGRGFYLAWRTALSGTMLHWVVEKDLSEVHMRVLLDGGIDIVKMLKYLVGVLRVWRVCQYTCTEYGGCVNTNVRSVVGASIQMYRVLWMRQSKCTECGGFFNTNVQSVVDGSIQMYRVWCTRYVRTNSKRLRLRLL